MGHPAGGPIAIGVLYTGRGTGVYLAVVRLPLADFIAPPVIGIFDLVDDRGSGLVGVTGDGLDAAQVVVSRADREHGAVDVLAARDVAEVGRV